MPSAAAGQKLGHPLCHKEGDRSPYVRDIRQRLANLKGSDHEGGYPATFHFTIDEDFGPNLTPAVRRFQ